MGPDKNGNFKPVTVKGIHENRVDIPHASKGASICIAVKTANKKDLPLKTKGMRKGMSLIEISKNYQATKKNLNPLDALVIREFDAEV